MVWIDFFSTAVGHRRLETNRRWSLRDSRHIHLCEECTSQGPVCLLIEVLCICTKLEPSMSLQKAETPKNTKKSLDCSFNCDLNMTKKFLNEKWDFRWPNKQQLAKKSLKKIPQKFRWWWSFGRWWFPVGVIMWSLFFFWFRWGRCHFNQLFWVGYARIDRHRVEVAFCGGGWTTPVGE